VPPSIVPTKPRIDQKDDRLRNSSASQYPALLKRVRETLLLGQQRIEQARVETYWRTGKLIHEHSLHHKNRAEFGKQVIRKLAEDLEVGDDLLYRALKFHQAFPISATSRKLTWSHFVELSKVADDKTRLALTQRAEKSEWTAKQLAVRIQQETSFSVPQSHDAAKSIPQLTPKLGVLYTYRLIAPESAHEKEDNDRLWIDLGFKIRKRLPESAKGFRAGQIIESLKQTESGDYTVKASKHGEEALFTYKAFIERVIDGDTLAVKIDLGFETEQTHYLRLRGIDCPELTEAAGKKAKSFVEKQIGKVPYVLMTSTRSDKYGRYLADLHIPLKDAKTEFLNQRLLDEGLAVKL